MRAPRTKRDKFTCVYKQVPYDNRYFFVYYDGEEVAKVPKHLERHSLVYRLMNMGIDRRWENWYKFLNRVAEYDKYLDDNDN